MSTPPAAPAPTRPGVVRFVAPAEAALGAVLARLGADPDALAEGRVFVGTRRASSATAVVHAGQTVAVSARTEAPTQVPILHRDEDLLVVDKPAGMPTIPDSSGAHHALLAVAARVAGLAESRLHPTSRLDREVSGIVTFALTSRGRERLERARAQGDYRRRYVALAVRAPVPEAGRVEAAIGRARDPRHRQVDPAGKPASTRYLTVAETSGAALLALAPETGRTHQLRVHAAHLGAPLLGDRTYGGPTRLALASGKVLGLDRVYLHCARVCLPGAAGALALASAVPEALRVAWAALGGADPAWEQASAWETLPG